MTDGETDTRGAIDAGVITGVALIVLAVVGLAVGLLGDVPLSMGTVLATLIGVGGGLWLVFADRLED